MAEQPGHADHHLAQVLQRIGARLGGGMRRDGDIRIREHRIVRRARLVVRRVETEAAEVAGRQRIEYRRTLDAVESSRSNSGPNAPTIIGIMGGVRVKL
jgi:hypothetical protein